MFLIIAQKGVPCNKHNVAFIGLWFDIRFHCGIMQSMKKFVLFFMCLCMLALGGCGVKSGLSRPDGPLRNYPVV